MHCADLDRYLEAHLDGRLGRTRTASLRRHLASCGSCRRRVLLLDAFAREVAEQVKSRCSETVWSSLLSPDVHQATLGSPVTLALPPPFPSSWNGPPPNSRVCILRSPHPAITPAAAGVSRVRRILLRGAGCLFLFAALGSVVQLVSAIVAPQPPLPASDRPRSVDAQTPRDVALDIATGDPEVLAAWFAGVLGEAYPVPAPPAGFELIGGRRDSFAGQPLAAIIYRRSPDLLTLYVARRTHTADLKALSPSSWGGRNWLFGIAGNWQDPDVAAFRAATWALSDEVETVIR